MNGGQFNEIIIYKAYSVKQQTLVTNTSCVSKTYSLELQQHP